jgi:TusA-related sulfurtransferase
MPSDHSTAHAFLDALVRRDFDALEATLDPAVRFRALVPGESVAVTTAADTAACFRRWFTDKTDIEILDQQVDVLVDRLRIGYRARLRKNGQPYLVAQQLFGDLDDGRFVSLDLLCTGFRPEAGPPAHDTTHVFDAGDLGCGSGLPREFRTRVSQIPVGHVLEVITGDPSAREDLPSMARLLGHQVKSVETGADGNIRIRVERVK